MSSSADPESVGPATPANPLEIYGNYPFLTDETYQQGLSSLLKGGALDNNPPQDVKEEILRRTRVFYFNRVTGSSITMDEAREYEHSLRDAAQATNDIARSQSDSNETRVLTFAELQELIETGNVDQIPNNKLIPEALNEASPSESTARARKKPWELPSDSEGKD